MQQNGTSQRVPVTMRQSGALQRVPVTMQQSEALQRVPVTMQQSEALQRVPVTMQQSVVAPELGQAKRAVSRVRAQRRAMMSVRSTWHGAFGRSTWQHNHSGI